MSAPQFSNAINATTLPPIPIARSWLNRYKGSEPILNLSQGVPGDPPQDILLQALAKSSSDPASAGYGDIAGEASLRKAVAEEMNDMYQLDETSTFSASNVVITIGANSSMLSVLMSLCDPGSEVIMPTPAYFNAMMMAQMLSLVAVPLALDPENGFLPSVTEAEKLITPQTRAIALTTPNNPTGSTYSPALISSFADLASKHGIFLLVDETYRDFVTPEPGKTRGMPHDLYKRPDWEKHVISFFSFSKSYKIPGHRLGGIIAGEETIAAISKVLDCMQICPPRPPQIALAPILPDLRDDLATTSARIASRLLLFREQVAKAPGWSIAADGGFYSFVKHPYKGVPSATVCEKLGVEFGVITLPGSFFMPEKGTKEWGWLEEKGAEILEDRWIRFAVPNIPDESVLHVGERLLAMNKAMNYEQ